MPAVWQGPGRWDSNTATAVHLQAAAPCTDRAQNIAREGLQSALLTHGTLRGADGACPNHETRDGRSTKQSNPWQQPVHRPPAPPMSMLGLLQPPKRVQQNQTPGPSRRRLFEANIEPGGLGGSGGYVGRGLIFLYSYCIIEVQRIA